MYKTKGKVIAILPVKSGVSKDGAKEWKRQNFVLELDEAFSRRVVFQLMGADNVDKADLRLGEEIEVKARVEGHCYQDSWYNDIRVYDIYRSGRSILQDKG